MVVRHPGAAIFRMPGTGQSPVDSFPLPPPPRPVPFYTEWGDDAHPRPESRQESEGEGDVGQTDAWVGWGHGEQKMRGLVAEDGEQKNAAHRVTEDPLRRSTASKRLPPPHPSHPSPRPRFCTPVTSPLTQDRGRGAHVDLVLLLCAVRLPGM